MWVEVYSYILVGIILLYSFQFVKYGIVLTFSPKNIEAQLSNDFLQVSVIIPVRNELESLKLVLSDLKKQSYPSSYYEVLIINDHSTDTRPNDIQKIVLKNSNFRYLSLGSHESGKKAAIAMGVDHAKGDWIIQTDADCRLKENFIMLHASKASGHDISLLAGPVVFRTKKDLWNKFESLEFLSLAGAGMASFLIGNPVMCNGANLSYSKRFYLDISENLSANPSPSGDDIFLLAEAKRLQKRTEFLYTSESIVLTEPAGSFRAFINQRVRWGSKSRFYKDPGMIYITILVWLTNAGLLSGLIFSLFWPDLFLLFIVLLGTKSLADFWILFQTAKFFNRKSLLPFFFPATIIYYFYITFTGLASIIGGFSWKGRRYL